jgi:zinc protease
VTPLSEHGFGTGPLRARKFMLPNGLGVILVADPSAPVCAYHTWFRVGSRYEHPGRTGLAHLFEHLMFNETEALPPGEFDRRMEALGADTNAATWLDWTYYREVVPSRHLDEVMALEAERMARLVVHSRQLEAERKVVANERRQRVDNDVDGFLSEQLYKLAFDVHPYRWPTIGWMEDIEAITLDDARAFHRTYYAPNNATIVIVGDLDEQRVLGDLERHYGGMAPQWIAPVDPVEEPPQQAERRAHFEQPVMADRLVIGWRACGIEEPDHAALEVASELLFNGQSSLLYKRLVVETEIASSVSADAPPFRDPGLFEVRVSMQRGHRAGEAEAIIYDALDKAAREPVSDADLAKARNRIEAHLWHSLRGHDGRAEGLGHHETTAGDYRFLFEAARRVQQLDGERLRGAIERNLAAARRTVLTAEPAKKKRGR